MITKRPSTAKAAIGPWAALLAVTVAASSAWPGTSQGAERVSPDRISTGRELSQAISPDGRLLVFARRQGSRFDLMIAERGASDWSSPSAAPFNSEFTDADPFFSADGTRLYFLSTRPGPGESAERERPDIWVVERRSAGWTEPHNDLAVNGPDTGEGFMSLTRDGDMVLASDRDRPAAAHDIYRSKRNGTGFEPPRRMDLGIRTEGYTNPLIGPDGDFLIFESELYPGAGSDDLFIVFRSGRNWTGPVNLGPSVNSEKAEGAPNLSPDGGTLYFARMQRGEDGVLISNLYRVAFGPVLARARRLAFDAADSR